MKKLLLSALAFAGSFGLVSAANTLTVINLTSCPYTLSISGSNGSFIGANSTATFNSFPTVDIGAIKIMYVSGSNYTQVNVSYGSPYSNSIGQPTPPCLTNSYFTASWAQSSPSANATLVIFE